MDKAFNCWVTVPGGPEVMSRQTVRILTKVSLQDIQRARPENIFYGATTCWWTHRREHLARHPKCGLPCDPRGGMLFETDDVDGFLNAAIESPNHYGEGGLDVFMAAHHENCVRTYPDHIGWYPWCFRTWGEYADAMLTQEADNDRS